MKNLESLSSTEKLKFYLYVIKLLLKNKKKRTQELAKSEYNDGIYQYILNKRPWETAKSLDEFVFEMTLSKSSFEKASFY